MKFVFPALLTTICLTSGLLWADESWPPALETIVRSIDLNVGESGEVKLSDGSSAAVKLVGLEEIRDDLRHAVREVRVTVEVNGQQTTLVAYNYHLPVALGGVQIDCPITKGCVQPKANVWVLYKDARLRLWPAGSPWIQPGTFMYPMHVRWFSSMTHMANEPVYVDGSEDPAQKGITAKPGKPLTEEEALKQAAKDEAEEAAKEEEAAKKEKEAAGKKEEPAKEEKGEKKKPAEKAIYYHYGLDTGGAEGLVDVFAAADSVVAVAGNDTIMPKKEFPSPEIKPRYDVIYLRDGRGWYYRYSHLDSFDPAVKVGAKIKIGQKIGVLGKRGASGGWSHLHFDIVTPQPNGKFGITDAYAYFWQAYVAQYHPQLQAVARPHHLAWAGEEVALDGSFSWSAKGPGHIAKYEWTLSDGRKVEDAKATQRYPYSGEYSEILKVTDDEGRVSYDFAVVQIVDREHPDLLPSAIHAVYWPTLDLKAGDEVTFRVRSFDHSNAIGKSDGAPEIGERWNFGDGTPGVEVHSVRMIVDKRGKDSTIYAKDGYATTTHRYAKPGDYLVSVSRVNSRGQTATARLTVHIDP